MWFRTLVERNNDPDDEYHFNLFSPVIIGREVQAANDILHLNVTTPWFLLNVLSGIATGWVFQLNGDATFSFCKSAVDMIGLGVNSLGKHNHPLCWSIIQHSTEKNRGRYFLCHSTHGGTNNNMVVEVDWPDVKKICPQSSNLGTFLGAMFHLSRR